MAPESTPLPPPDELPPDEPPPDELPPAELPLVELAPPDELPLVALPPPDEPPPPDVVLIDELLLVELAPPDELPLVELLSPDELPLVELATDAPPLPDALELELLPLDEPLVVAALGLPVSDDDGLGGTKLVSQPTEGAIVAHAPVNAIPSQAKDLKDRSAIDLSFPGANQPHAGGHRSPRAGAT